MCAQRKKIPRLVSVILVCFAVFVQAVHSQAPSLPEASNKETTREKPQYALNVPASGFLGLIGWGVGSFAGVVVSLPFCLAPSVTKGCIMASTSLVYVGGSLGMGIAVDAISKKFGLRHKTFLAMTGALVGNIPFAYFYSQILTYGDTSGSPYSMGAALSIAAAIIIDIVFVYVNSFYNEDADVHVAMNMRNYFSETIFQPAITKRF